MECTHSTDAELINDARDGAVEAFDQLYRHHVAAAYNLARQLSRRKSDADDLVSETFIRVFDQLRAGRGPNSAFRAYLLTALRHVAYDKTRRDRKIELTDDVTTTRGVRTERISQAFRDTALDALECSLAREAFGFLPDRWQTVLWFTVIEGQSPAEVAPILGLTANGVSALAYRAREALREAYLRAHATNATPERCRSIRVDLGAWIRGGLGKRQTAAVAAHLDQCGDCEQQAAELGEVNATQLCAA